MEYKMQPYSKNFSRVFNMKLFGFSQKVAPLILDFYKGKIRGTSENMLDLCCGTGQLAKHFLQRNFRVTGIDLSEHMLNYAKENTYEYITSGQAKFLCLDATSFSLNDKFGLVVSTFDSLNHLQDEEALFNCFQCVYEVCDDVFIFDLKTKVGLKNWSRIEIEDYENDALIITSGIYDDNTNKAWLRMFGFVHSHEEFYERFEEIGFGTVFDLNRVRNLLLEIGWKDVYFAKCDDLNTKVLKPESEERIFVVARRSIEKKL